MWKIGDRVRISPTSKYRDQSAADGVIVDLSPGRWFHVRFDDGYANNYPASDLVSPLPYDQRPDYDTMLDDARTTRGAQ